MDDGDFIRFRLMWAPINPILNAERRKKLIKNDLKFKRESLKQVNKKRKK